MVQAHYEPKPMQDVGDAIFYMCEKCHNHTYQTVMNIESVKCDAHNLTIGFDYHLRCDVCKSMNHKKVIQVYPCE